MTPLQFFGIDLNPFAVELARVTLMIARKIAIDNFGILDQPALPLDSLDQNIVCADVLFTEWPKADAIVGNPLFLGGSRIRLELGDKYAERVFKKFSDARAQVDLACYWFRLAHETIGKNGRAGLVATNSISQGKSRSVSLDYIAQNNGYIHDAVTTQIWSGEAAVHVSIVNWSKQNSVNLYLDNKIISIINSSLKATANSSDSIRLKANLNKGFVGIQPNGKGFYIDESTALQWIESDLSNADILKRSSSATDLADSPNGAPRRWLIDFKDMPLEDSSDYRLPFEHIKKTVKPERDSNREMVLREKWWRFKRTNESLRNELESCNLYFIIPRHSKWFIFVKADKSWLPADSTTAIASDDFYVLGILTSNVHRTWVKAQSSTLEDRTRYTHNTCFETFPFPQTPTQKQIDAIRKTAIELHEYRSAQRSKNNGESPNSTTNTLTNPRLNFPNFTKR